MLFLFQVMRESPMRKKLIGVIGGMGPLATADFLKKLVEVTPAQRDQDHIPVIVWGDPRTPDRTQALLNHGPSPETALCLAAQTLETTGARALVIPCNTAHAWAPAIADCVSVPIISMIEAVIRHAQDAKVTRLGVMATRGTIFSGTYQAAAHQAGIEICFPHEAFQSKIDQGIAAVKASRIDVARPLLKEARAHLIGQGAQAIVQGCTEIPLAMSETDPHLIDATRVLALAARAWSEA
jgi:aspartate racemase